jgi:hypothetical protein
MRMAKVFPQSDWVLSIVADDGRLGNFDVALLILPDPYSMMEIT